MTGKYSLIYADPPWSYGNTISNGALPFPAARRAPVARLIWNLSVSKGAPDGLHQTQ